MMQKYDFFFKEFLILRSIKFIGMKTRLFLILFAMFFVAISLNAENKTVMPSDARSLKSPDGQLELKFAVVDGVPMYSLDRDGKSVVKPSRMGFTLEWRDDLAHAFVLKNTKCSNSHPRNSFTHLFFPLRFPGASLKTCF